METAKKLIDKLDQFPHIKRRLEFQWGSKECRLYLHSLTIADRPNRRGFPFEIVTTIYDLLELHDDEFPKFIPKLGVWDL
jgi:hypothetical protein